MSGSEKKIYIVVSQTGTVLSRILRQITGAEYNHASISLRSDLYLMYSFGRRHPYNPFWGGFVTESPHFGTFKRFSNTRAKVLELSVSAEQYDAICNTLDAMVRDRKKYHYNYRGLFLAAFRICSSRDHCYYCSEFVKEMLLRHGIEPAEAFPSITQPVHFLNLPEAKAIYCGRLRDYAV